MNGSPIDVALQHVNETKHLLDALITSSETFDYQKAKLTLQALRKKSRELGKLRTRLLSDLTDVPQNILALPTASQAVRANETRVE